MEQTTSKKIFTVKEMAFTAMFAALLAVCSWISIPLSVPITLQTFAVFAAIALMGTKCSFTAIGVWILLCAAGVPVLSGFKGGIGSLTGPTGGYILGFLLCPLIVGGIEKLLGKKLPIKAAAMLIALVICYAFGTVWYVVLYSRGGSEISFIGALKICVIPFAAFDCIKIALALILDNRIGKLIDLH